MEKKERKKERKRDIYEADSICSSQDFFSGQSDS